MSHSRVRRCEILLEFAETYFAKEEAEEKERILSILKESLTFDLYYRENCKSRPYWAPAVSEFKKITKHFCKNGSLSHVEPFHYRFPKKNEWKLENLPERLEECIYVLFDYQRRDPLDHQAEVEEVCDYISSER